MLVRLKFFSLLFAMLLDVAIAGSGQIKLIQFLNPLGHGREGKLCDTLFGSWVSDCDHFFELCVSTRYTPDAGSHDCDVHYSKSSFVSNANNVLGTTFDRILGVQSFSFANGLSTYVRITVMEHDYESTNEIVEVYRIPLYEIYPGNWKVFVLTQDQQTIQFKLRIKCEANWFGTLCSRQCAPGADDSTGYYTCDSNGTKMCSAGWTGANCNKVAATFSFASSTHERKESTPTAPTRTSITSTPSTATSSTAHVPDGDVYVTTYSNGADGDEQSVSLLPGGSDYLARNNHAMVAAVAGQKVSEDRTQLDSNNGELAFLALTLLVVPFCAYFFIRQVRIKRKCQSQRSEVVFAGVTMTSQSRSPTEDQTTDGDVYSLTYEVPRQAEERIKDDSYDNLSLFGKMQVVQAIAENANLAMQLHLKYANATDSEAPYDYCHPIGKLDSQEYSHAGAIDDVYPKSNNFDRSSVQQNSEAISTCSL